MKSPNQELRKQIVHEHEQGLSASKLADKYDLPLGTIKSWLKRQQDAAKKRSAGASKHKRKSHPNKNNLGSEKPTQQRPGAPLGNKNAVGNRGGPGGPPNNKKAVATHEYESIIFDVLPEEEQEAWLRVNTDKYVQLNIEIRTLELRERRMLQRIESLRQAQYTMVSYEVEQGGDEDTIKQKFDGTLGQIQRIEDALTRVQGQKARLLKLRNEFEELELRKKESELKNW